MHIPKIIFQTWKSKTDLPTSFKFWSDSLKTINPTFVYRLWDDADNRAFIEKNYPWFLETYDGFPAEIYRADAVRYFFLYEYGGVYADMDMQCLLPLDHILSSGGVVLGRMGTNPKSEHSIPNAWMASSPKEEFWLLVISLMMSADKNKRPEYVTGPAILKKAVDLYMDDYREDVVQNRLAVIRQKMTSRPNEMKSKLTILPSHVIYPLDWMDVIHDEFVRKPLLRDNKVFDHATARKFFPRSYMLTIWSHSWEPQDLS
jgi:mannosyltransferase OCH1-like enzyme